MDDRTLLVAAQMRAAEALPDDPVEAARNFREAFRHARALGDRQYAAAQLAGVAVAYSLLRRRRAAIRVLKLASRYAPQWHTPHGLVGTELEHEAEVELDRQATSKAKARYLEAAFHLRRASELAVLGGADDDSAEVKDQRERASACLERARVLSDS